MSRADSSLPRMPTSTSPPAPDSTEIARERYCSPVTLENCSALLIEFETPPPEILQCIFWRDRAPFRGLKTDRARLRDLRPGDVVEFLGTRRKIIQVQVFR